MSGLHFLSTYRKISHNFFHGGKQRLRAIMMISSFDSVRPEVNHDANSHHDQKNQLGTHEQRLVDVIHLAQRQRLRRGLSRLLNVVDNQRIRGLLRVEEEVRLTPI